jgi:multisubunit Na+/H+ antiporter MnhB subunit
MYYMSKFSSFVWNLLLRGSSPGERRRRKRELLLVIGLGTALALIFGAVLYLLNKQGRF